MIEIEVYTDQPKLASRTHVDSSEIQKNKSTVISTVLHFSKQRKVTNY